MAFWECNLICYPKVEQDGSFVIISIEYGKALECMKVDDYTGSQVSLVDINEGEHWVMMEDGTIASKATLEDEMMYFDHHQFLYVGRKEKNTAIHCTLQTNYIISVSLCLICV